MNKKLLVAAILSISVSYIGNVFADSAVNELKTKLVKYDAIKNDFIQKISAPDGTILNEGKGSLIISRPGKVIWETIEPEKEKIISNGKTVWFYTPFIEQVMILNYTSAIEGSPFMLLAGTNEERWDEYNITKENNKFIIKKKKNADRSSSFILSFDGDDHLSTFSNVEASGQTSHYSFKTYKDYNKPADNIFEFKIPKGVEVDDQR